MNDRVIVEATIPGYLIDRIRGGIEADERVGEPICSTAHAARQLIDWIDENVLA